MFMKSFGMPALTALAISAVAPAIAQTTIQERRVVLIDRADLLTAEGRAKIEAQINRAARQVCEPKDRRSVQFIRGVTECRATATADLDQRVAAAKGNVEIAVVNDNAVSR